MDFVINVTKKLVFTIYYRFLSPADTTNAHFSCQ